ncbi:MAG: capsule polysaccharide export protein KpsE/RkpR [Vicingaceae bacterium]
MAFISAIIFSLLIEDKYESSVILFPSTTTSISRALLNDENYKEKDFLEFGEEEEAEQLIQLLNSDTIRNYIIQKFNLMSHYDINPHEEYRQTQLFNEYKGNIDFYRTKFMSVKIEVLDTDKEYAANIANEITKKVDEVRNNILQKAAKQGFVIVEKEYNNLVAEINRMEDTLNQIRAKGVQDYETQVEVLSNQYGAALVKGNNAAAKALQNKLDTLSKYGGKYLSLVQQMEYEREKLSDLRKVYSEARVNAESTIDQTFIVNRAYPAEKASYPIRWIIVVASTIATFLFTVIVLILFDPKA